MTNQTIKHCAGSYSRTDGTNSVTVRYHEHLKGWIASADWEHYLFTDPVATKREAVLNADHMLLHRTR